MLFSLIGIGIVAGLVAGISPCILPVLPVVLVAGATTDRPQGTRRLRLRPIAVVVGLVLSFSAFTLAGSALLSAVGLPQDFLRDAGLVILGLVGLGLLVPKLGEILERPFVRFSRRPPLGATSGFVLGLGLGALFVPCAGPVLAAITAVGAMRRFGLDAVALTLAFSIGAGVPLLLVAVAGDRIVERVRSVRQRAPVVRRIGGVVLLALTIAMATNLTDGLQRVVPGYTNTLQNAVEGSSFAKNNLSAVTGESAGTLGQCVPDSPLLARCGAAPQFRDIAAWLNTPHGSPLTIAGLRGKVVLIDFWTYSCINCQRALPHVEAWYRRYAPDGLVVIGVHTPEFAFEHVVSNVTATARQLGVVYPIAVDNSYGTWDAYQNNYWPAEYLIDATGELRHVAFGEGGYSATETFIRNLLVAAHPGIHLPARTDVPDRTPNEPLTSETYLGYDRLAGLSGQAVVENAPFNYVFPKQSFTSGLDLAGTWTIGPQSIRAGKDAKLRLKFTATDVYLVMGGHGTLDVRVNGGARRSIAIDGIPKLYTVVSGPGYESRTLVISASHGTEAYDFTFG